jgi:hypothetical protein
MIADDLSFSAQDQVSIEASNQISARGSEESYESLHSPGIFSPASASSQPSSKPLNGRLKQHY